MTWVEIGTIAPGSTVKMGSGKEVTIMRHGEMGTIIRSVNRVAKSVTDPATGKTVKFSSAAEAYVVSSASPCQAKE